MIKAVILDMDGTLIDSTRPHALAFQEAFAQFGKDVVLEDILSHIGKSTGQIMRAFWSAKHIEEFGEEIDNVRKEIFAEKYCSKVRGFPKAKELVHRLKREGKRIIVASCGSEDDVMYFMGALGIEGLVDDRATADDVARCKPETDIFELALRRAGISSKEAIAVGDSPFDIQAARRVGLPVIALLSGGFSREKLEESGAYEVYQDIEELYQRYDHSLFSK